MSVARTDRGFYLAGGFHSHFRVDEFRCRCGDCEFTDVHERLIEVLEHARVASGGAIHVTSGIRCLEHNARIGGARLSRHVPELYNGIGMAADVSSRVMDPDQLAILLARYLGVDGGIGLYSQWVHVDVRNGSAFWEGT